MRGQDCHFDVMLFQLSAPFVKRSRMVALHGISVASALAFRRRKVSEKPFVGILQGPLNKYHIFDSKQDSKLNVCLLLLMMFQLSY